MISIVVFDWCKAKINDSWSMLLFFWGPHLFHNKLHCTSARHNMVLNFAPMEVLKECQCWEYFTLWPFKSMKSWLYVFFLFNWNPQRELEPRGWHIECGLPTVVIIIYHLTFFLNTRMWFIYITFMWLAKQTTTLSYSHETSQPTFLFVLLTHLQKQIQD